MTIQQRNQLIALAQRELPYDTARRFVQTLRLKPGGWVLRPYQAAYLAALYSKHVGR